MATEYLSDQEQEEALRSWWKENWSWVASGIAVGFVVLAGWNYWQRRVDQRGEAAAQAYRDLTQALAGADKTGTDKDKVDTLVKNLDSDYSGTPYVDQAHLLVAQSHVNGGRYEMAVTELKAVAEKSKDPGLAQIAKLRLARVHIQLGHYDEALALLDVSKAGKFAEPVNEIRGDALFAKGDVSGARAAYQAAIAAAQSDPQQGMAGSEYLQLKLQELGPAPEAAVVTPPTPLAPKEAGSDATSANK